MNLNDLVGLAIEEANDRLNIEGKTIRIARSDGQPLVGTRDYNLNRVNVEVSRDRISRVLGIG